MPDSAKQRIGMSMPLTPDQLPDDLAELKRRLALT